MVLDSLQVVIGIPSLRLGHPAKPLDMMNNIEMAMITGVS